MAQSSLGVELFSFSNVSLLPSKESVPLTLTLSKSYVLGGHRPKDGGCTFVVLLQE